MLSDIAFYGALETGLIYGLVAFGIYLSFRVLDFPDLTVDGSFPLGAAVAAMLIIEGWNPWLATGCAVLAAAAPPASAMNQEPRARVGQLWRLLPPSRLQRGICHNNRHIVIRRPA